MLTATSVEPSSAGLSARGSPWRRVGYVAVEAPPRASAWDSRGLSATLAVPSRFNGPLESGQGGYCSGLVAGFVAGAAEVSLRRPVQLDTPLRISPQGDGSARVFDDDALVAEARPAAAFSIEVPAPVSLDEARSAAKRYRGLSTGLFSRCFVCGRARP